MGSAREQGMTGAARQRAATQAPEELQALLDADHAALATRFQLVLSALRAGAHEQAVELWFEFDRELRTRFALEEQYLLPELATLLPEEAAGLRAEHAELRCRLDQLGTGVELHLTREQSLAEFFALLSAHAEREQRLLHGFTEEQLPERSRAASRALLLDARRRFAALRDGDS